MPWTGWFSRPRRGRRPLEAGRLLARAALCEEARPLELRHREAADLEGIELELLLRAGLARARRAGGRTRAPPRRPAPRACRAGRARPARGAWRAAADRGAGRRAARARCPRRCVRAAGACRPRRAHQREREGGPLRRVERRERLVHVGHAAREQPLVDRRSSPAPREARARSWLAVRRRRPRRSGRAGPSSRPRPRLDARCECHGAERHGAEGPRELGRLALSGQSSRCPS